jgi:hypothetical protein
MASVVIEKGKAMDHTFVIVLLANSAARLPEEEEIELLGLPGPSGPADIIIRTRYVDEGYEAKVPRELWLEVRGRGASLDPAISTLAGMGATLLPVLALVANAAILDPVLHLAFEDTAGVREREFFQAFVPDETGPPFSGRRIDPDALTALLHAIFAHPDGLRIQRAIGQYEFALRHWVHGQETMALAHLFMGMEALTKVFLRRECNAKGMKEDELAASYGIEKKHLDPFIRKTLLFKGDWPCLKRAKDASDGFEHGFLDFNRVRTLATEVRDQTATYLRDAILEISGCDPKVLAAIREGRYLVPLGAWKMVKHVRGTLAGEGPTLAEDSQCYPRIKLTSTIQSFRKLESGRYEFTPNETLAVSLGPGIEFKDGTFKVWGPNDGTEGVPSTATAEFVRKLDDEEKVKA